MAKYRLKPGFTHYEFVSTGENKGHRRMEPGDTCELTESQAKAFGDRFEPVGKKAETDEQKSGSGEQKGGSGKKG